MRVCVGGLVTRAPRARTGLDSRIPHFNFKLNSNSCTVLITLVFVYQVQNENKFRTDHSCNEIALTFDMDLWELLHCYSNKFKKLQMVVWFDMSYGKL